MPFQMDPSGDGTILNCLGEFCSGGGAREEFAGYCEVCWLELTEQEREILKRDYKPDPPPTPRPVIHQHQTIQPVIERVRVVYPATHWVETWMRRIWVSYDGRHYRSPRHHGRGEGCGRGHGDGKGSGNSYAYLIHSDPGKGYGIGDSCGGGTLLRDGSGRNRKPNQVELRNQHLDGAWYYK